MKYTYALEKCLEHPVYCETFGSIVITVDGTYIHIQENADNQFQRITCSEKKKRHLVKPMVVICVDGYIIDVASLYLGKDDITIFKTILQCYQVVFEAQFKPGDVFIVDRGFRNVKSELKNKGFIIKILMCTAIHQEQSVKNGSGTYKSTSPRTSRNSTSNVKNSPTLMLN